MCQPFASAVSNSFDDSDPLERGIHGYYPFRRICRLCGSLMIGRNASDALARHDCSDSFDFALFEGSYPDDMEGGYVFDDIDDVLDYQ